MKKVLCLVLMFALLLSQASSIFAGNQNTSYLLKNATNYTGRSTGCGDFNFNINMDYNWFIQGDNTVYYNEIGKFCAVLACAAYNDGTSSTAAGDIPGYGTAFMDAVGLTDTMKVDVDHHDGTEDSDVNDTANMLLGHIKKTYKNENYEIIFVSVRGTHTNEDMINDLDFGANSQRYCDLEGYYHPDWYNPLNHKGFDVSATRCVNVLDNYITNYTDTNAKRILVFTGHSKGATVANLMATRYIDGEGYTQYTDCKVFAYCIAPCNNTEAEQSVIDSYKSIFNINNADDIITILPFKEWDYRRYGQALIFSTNNDAEMYQAITGEAYAKNNLTVDGILFSEITNSRAGFYEIDMSDNSKTDLGTGLKAPMTSKYNSIVKLLTDSGLINFVSFDFEKTGGSRLSPMYTLTMHCSPVFLLKLFVLVKDELAEEDYVGLAEYISLLPAKYYTYLMQAAQELETIGTAHMGSSIYVCANQTFGYNEQDFISEADFNTTGSIFGQGYTTAIIVMACLVVGTGVALATGKKKKKNA